MRNLVAIPVRADIANEIGQCDKSHLKQSLSLLLICCDIVQLDRCAGTMPRAKVK
jgi:hypothetical protein